VAMLAEAIMSRGVDDPSLLKLRRDVTVRETLLFVVVCRKWCGERGFFESVEG
jgi:hypothetical protein